MSDVMEPFANYNLPVTWTFMRVNVQKDAFKVVQKWLKRQLQILDWSA